MGPKDKLKFIFFWLFSANPRPDALMKEQLTEMTGLSPRVVRVWFQNKRCKEKKKMREATKVRFLTLKDFSTFKFSAWINPLDHMLCPLERIL